MSSIINKVINKVKSQGFLNNSQLTDQEIIDNWVNLGKPSPPPHLIKQLTIKDYKNQYHHNVFIETGTFMGDMIEAQKKDFNKLYSIELAEELYKKAVERFSSDKKITILQGDSGKVLFELMPKINEPAIFWLDGHYSAGITAKGEKFCPIYEELTAIFNNKALNHILLIDDARLFIGEEDYPTYNELSDFIKKYRPNSEIFYKHDIIHVILK